MTQFENERGLLRRGVISKRPSNDPAIKRFIPKRLLLQWHITDRCNLNCSHCYQSGIAYEPPMRDLMTVLDQYIEALEKMGVRGHINITGGEPLARIDFFELAEIIREHREKISFAVLTNGTLIDDEKAGMLKKLGVSFVQVSIEGGRKTNDTIRGNGTFERVMESVRLLKRCGIRTLVSFTAHKANFKEFGVVANASRKNGAYAVWSDRLVPLGRGEDYRNILLSKKETKELFDAMYAVGNRFFWRPFCPTEILMHRALQFITLKEKRTKNVKPYRCFAGRSLLTVMPDGTLLPCRRMPVSVGNIHKKCLYELYYSSSLLSALRDPSSVSEGCDSCEHSKTCGGGLRCLAYAVYGTPFKKDPQCFLDAYGAGNKT